MHISRKNIGLIEKSHFKYPSLNSVICIFICKKIRNMTIFDPKRIWKCNLIGYLQKQIMCQHLLCHFGPLWIALAMDAAVFYSYFSCLEPSESKSRNKKSTYLWKLYVRAYFEQLWISKKCQKPQTVYAAMSNWICLRNFWLNLRRGIWNDFFQ